MFLFCDISSPNIEDVLYDSKNILREQKDMGCHMHWLKDVNAITKRNQARHRSYSKFMQFEKKKKLRCKTDPQARSD